MSPLEFMVYFVSPVTLLGGLYVAWAVTRADRNSSRD
jgi:hypothetical protein